MFEMKRDAFEFEFGIQWTEKNKSEKKNNY